MNDGVYLGSEGRIRASCCHSHARRKFEAAKSNDPARASRALGLYRQLYEIEDRALDFSAAERLKLRQAESVPILEEFKAWLDAQSPQVLPKSAVGAAIRYALNQWQPLLALTQDGSLPIDNSDTERDLRRLAAGQSDLAQLLPDRWVQTHPDSIRTYRKSEQESRRAKKKDRRAARPYPFKKGGNGGWSLSVAQQVLSLPGVTKTDYAANSGDAIYSAAETFTDTVDMWVPSNYKSLDKNAAWTNTSKRNTRFYQSGISYYRSEVRPAKIADGLSHTYWIGEKFLQPGGYEDINTLAGVEVMGDNQSAWSGYEWDNHRVAWNPSSRWPPEDYQPSKDYETPSMQNVFAFGSAHSGVFNTAFCDGSVQRIAYDIDIESHRYQANRSDGQN